MFSLVLTTSVWFWHLNAAMLVKPATRHEQGFTVGAQGDVMKMIVQITTEFQTPRHVQGAFSIRLLMPLDM